MIPGAEGRQRVKRSSRGGKGLRNCFEATRRCCCGTRHICRDGLTKHGTFHEVVPSCRSNMWELKKEARPHISAHRRKVQGVGLQQSSNGSAIGNDRVLQVGRRGKSKKASNAIGLGRFHQPFDHHCYHMTRLASSVNGIESQ